MTLVRRRQRPPPEQDAHRCCRRHTDPARCHSQSRPTGLPPEAWAYTFEPPPLVLALDGAGCSILYLTAAVLVKASQRVRVCRQGLYVGGL